jgi:hypothetical protein
MNQLLLGASIPFIIGVTIYVARRCRATLTMLILVPLLMGIGSIWAIVPDLPRFIGKTGLYHQLAKDPRCDIFFWHYTIDKHELYSPLYPLAIVLILAALLFAAFRELTLSEREVS